jgi:hypothetical protein
MRPRSEIRLAAHTGPSLDPSKEIAAEILRRHREEARPSLKRWFASLLSKLWRATPERPEPPQWPLTGVRQPLGRGPRPRSGAIALKEPW